MNRWKRCFSLSRGPLPTTSALAENLSFTALFNAARTVDVCLGGGRTASFHLPLLSLQLITAKFMRFRHDLLPIKDSEEILHLLCTLAPFGACRVQVRKIQTKRWDVSFEKYLQPWQAETHKFHLWIRNLLPVLDLAFKTRASIQSASTVVRSGLENAKFCSSGAVFPSAWPSYWIQWTYLQSGQGQWWSFITQHLYLLCSLSRCFHLLGRSCRVGRRPSAPRVAEHSNAPLSVEQKYHVHRDSALCLRSKNVIVD